MGVAGQEIVVVNNDPSLLTTLEQWLEPLWPTVRTFESSHGALKYLGQHSARMVVCDLDMADIDGWRFCRLLRSPDFAVTNRTPVMVVSATFHSDSVANNIVRSLQVEKLLPVPCSRNDFEEAVRVLLDDPRAADTQTVLLVEDDELLRRAVRLGLEECGFRVYEAGGGAEALAQLAAMKPDIVVLDHMLTDMKGTEVLEGLRKTNLSTIVVVVTAYSSPSLAVQYTAAGADGFLRKPFKLEALIDAINAARKEHAVVNIEDIVETRTRSLREKEQHFRDLYENAPLGYHTVDDEGLIVSMNRIELDWLGYTADEVIGKKSITDLMTGEAQLQAAAAHQRHTEQQHTTWDELELELICKDCSILPVLVHGSAIYDTGGRVLTVRTIVRNLTDLRAARQEEALLQERLTRAERMEALGLLAGGVAHDLNNIMGPLVGLPDLIRDQLHDLKVSDKQINEDLESIRESANKSCTIIRDLLVMGQRGTFQAAPVELNGIITRYLASAEYTEMHERHRAVEMLTELSPNLNAIMATDAHVSQVIMNLVMNAHEAIDTSGAVMIATANVSVARTITGYEMIPEGKYVSLRVSDTGQGIAPEDIGAIFEPFHTRKKDMHSGTGLGLAVVYGVVKDLGGYIDVTTSVHEGATFTIYFPEVMHDARVGGYAAPEIKYGSERVLVADDALEQRQLMERFLSKLGYTVETVDNGEAAVRYVTDHEVDLVMLDMIMEEGFDGLDSYKEIVNVRPGQKCIIASGYSETDRIKEAIRLGVKRYLQKPYTLERLSTEIRDVLDAAV